MSYKVLVIGYGSIGKRHTKVLESMDMVGEVSVLSQQENLPYRTIRRLEDVKEVDPDYMVIASNTSLHYLQLCYLEEQFRGKTILVEKPLFGRFREIQIVKNKVYVGYNLRFHPLMRLIKEKVLNKKIWHVEALCGSYLPEWREGRDYRQTSSARKASGGGVLLDLSHELDYVQWFAGEIYPEYVRSEKVSDLDIETDDILLLAGRTESGASCHISLNYFTRKPVRQIIIDGEGISIQADLEAQTALVHENGKQFEHSWIDLSRNAMYEWEHEAVLSGDTTHACTHEDGLKIMRLIDNIKSWRKP